MEINLTTLNKNSESETLELKESLDSKAIETIGAFANTNGGTILVGVRDDGHITGVVIGDTTLEDWAQKMQAKIQPRFMPSITSHVQNGRTVIAIKVQRSDRPIGVDGRFIKRVGRTNQMMAPDEVRHRLLATSKITWDGIVEERASFADLDSAAITKFISMLNSAKRRTIPTGEPEITTLEKLALAEEGRPTRAAILLFGKNPRRFFHSAYIKAGRFKSHTLIVDDKEFDGNLFEQIEHAMSWFQNRLETKFIIGQPTYQGKKREANNLVQREEIWEYPLSALREAVLNAVCHRDYTSLANTTLRLYDDHLEIWNPGSLTPALRPEQLLQPHNSYPPNRLIADSFFNAGMIEKWGTGTVRIGDALKEQNLVPPVFDISMSETFKIIMSAIGIYDEQRLQQLGLNERQIKGIQHLLKGNRMTNTQYQNLVGASRATVSRDLSQLVDQGFISREGTTGKGTFYQLAQK